MDKSKLAQWGELLKTGGAQMGERLKTGGAQMSRIVSDKMKEILQAPTPESRMVDDATSETLEESNWGLNLRICAMINNETLSGSEIVRAIKKKISGKSVVSQSLSLELLEACTMNCEKVFSEVASEKVLEEMVKMIDDTITATENRGRAMELIRAWGESEDLAYLPVFHQTYMALKERLEQQGQSPSGEYSLESLLHQQPVAAPERYPIPNAGLTNSDHGAFQLNYRGLSVEEKKEFIAIARNSLELLSSILNTETDPRSLKEDLTVSMLEKCMESQPVIKGIIESTADDEGMLFEALYLHDELEKVISRYKESEANRESREQEPPEGSDEATENKEVVTDPKPVGDPPHKSPDKAEKKDEASQIGGASLPEKSDDHTQLTSNLKETKLSDLPEGESSQLQQNK